MNKTVLEKKSKEIIYKDGSPVKIILDIEEYQELLERLEDIEDLKMLKKWEKNY